MQGQHEFNDDKQQNSCSKMNLNVPSKNTI